MVVVVCKGWVLFMGVVLLLVGTGSLFVGAGLSIVGSGLLFVVGSACSHLVHIVCGWGLLCVAAVVPCHVLVVTVSEIGWNVDR